MLLPSELLIIIRQLQCVHAYETRERNWPFRGRTQKGVKPKTCIMNTEARHIATPTTTNHSRHGFYQLLIVSASKTAQIRRSGAILWGGDTGAGWHPYAEKDDVSPPVSPPQSI